jgi:omega-6 fatty acid desaturase (delta-12 desaturase)
MFRQYWRPRVYAGDERQRPPQSVSQPEAQSREEARMAIQRLEIVKSAAAGVWHGRTWPDWYPQMAAFRQPDRWKATWQLANTLIPYFVLWYLMIRSIQLGTPYALTLLLAVPAAGLLVRIFVLFHDCVHGSFLRSRRANTFWGYVLGLLVFTPYHDWRSGHLGHHATYANLDARGIGDVWTLTLAEYQSAPWPKRWLYRFFRHPLVFSGLGALGVFVLRNRVPAFWSKHKGLMSVLITNLLIVGLVLGADRIMGWRTFLKIQLPVLWMAGAAGIWLFYVQHQFPGVYWARKGQWDPVRAALEGSSFYRLPVLLNWCSASIGYHHVHHLGPRIPNYHLKACYWAIPALQAVPPITPLASLRCAGLKLWDEEHQRLVAFP